MVLELIGCIDLPKHFAGGGFDHGDVEVRSGKVFVAHTANGSIDVIDGERYAPITTLPNCEGVSGVLCAQEERLVFAAARGAGKVLVINSKSDVVINEVAVGPKPNGLAWDSSHKQLLVADVEDNHARLIEPVNGSIISNIQLPGRPRWCVYDRMRDRFLVNIKDPAGVAILNVKSLASAGFIPISVAGPHGLDIDNEAGRIFVACDEKAIVILDLKTEKEIQKIPISGEPDVIWYNQDLHRLYCAIAKPGVIDVIDVENMTMAEQIRTEEGAHTLAFDRERQQVYAFMPQSNQAAIYKEK